LDTNSREYAFDGSVPDLRWLEAELDGEGYDRAVVFSHVPPWNDDFDRSLAPEFTAILRRGAVAVSVHGHIHDFADRMEDGVRFVVADGMVDRSFLVITVAPEGVDVERTFF